jgi:transposase
MSVDTLARFILLPDLKLNDSYPLGNWGIGLAVEKTSTFEVCPHCATKTDAIYDHRKAKIKDAPIRGKAVFKTITKRRFRCKNRRCRKVFTEPVQGIAKGARTTHRFKRGVAWAASHYRSLKDVSKQYRCSARLVYSAFYQQLKLWAKARTHPLPEKIGLDEHSIRKPKYKAVEFATIVVDHGGKKVFDLIDGKSKAALSQGFAGVSGKSNVKVATIDCSETYRSFVRETFPKAMIVADRFHVERIFTRKVNKYRKKIKGADRKNPISRLLLRPLHKLEWFERASVINWLNHHPKLRAIWEVRQALSRFYRTKGYGRARRAFGQLLTRMAASPYQAVRALRKTLINWHDEIPIGLKEETRFERLVRTGFHFS